MIQIEKIASVPASKTDAKKILGEDLVHLPMESGIYIFRDQNGLVIYIGKAKSLRNRVRSYFRPNADDGRSLFRSLVRNIYFLEYIVTDTEVEALILEANLIKEHKPRYNTTLKDDKKYPYLKITKEPYPRIIVIRDISKDGSRYLGPYSDVKAMRNMLQTMHKLFRVRTCDYTLPVKNVRVCIDYEIGRCDGPCEDLVSESDYTEIIREAVLFLTGRHRKVVKILREKMKALSEDLRFEDAASYRDRLEAIKRATRRQKVVSHDLTDWDTIAISREDEEACGVVFEVRDGCLIGRQHYFLSVGLDSSDREVTREFLTQYYSACSFVPKEIILRHDLNEREAILDWLHRRSGGLVEMRIPQRGDKKELLLMAERNAELFLKERQLKRENSKSRIPNTLAALQRDLHLSKPPRQIEAIDISNIQGTDPVASLVCFVDGKPRKSEYRHYKIVGIDGPNDFAMMEQVVVRRFKRLMEEGKPFPDLLLIDGGKGQLSTAVSAIKNLGIDQPVIGLAKKLEEVFLPDYKDPQNIPKTSSSLKLLQALRNESHRFALSFHRKLRQKRTLASGLDYIEGVGPERKRLLLRHFGSVKRLKCATEKEIAEVVGIGPKLATIIFIGLK